MEYYLLEEKDRVTSYRNGSVVSAGGQCNLTPGVDPNGKNLPEGVDDDEDWEFDGAIG